MRYFLLVVALLLPSAAAYLYFVQAPLWFPGVGANAVMQGIYSGSKVVQFALPLLAGYWTWRERGRATVAVWVSAAGFGVAVGLALIGVYTVALRESADFVAAAPLLRTKVEQLGCGTPLRFLVLAGFLTLVHSGLEEYYWRGYADAELARMMPAGPALLLSSLAFAAHHAIVVGMYFPEPKLVALLTAGVAAGGAAWGLMRRASGSLAPAWLSHAIVDAALMLIGYDLLFRS